MKNWKKHDPAFEFDQLKHDSAWKGHFNFAYDLISFMQPKVFVELGTHYGGSFFSFCQGAKAGQLSTKCYAVDTWKGDVHAGFYDEDVFSVVEAVTAKYYSNHAKLIRMTFDEAATLFEDESIDLLHIDGLHTYEAVLNDYETWLPKLAPNGVILFHDIQVRIRDFGVYKFWDEIKTKFPSFEFHHSAGLGILFPKGVDDRFTEILDTKEDIRPLYEGGV
jgi:hypothetical protein